VLFFAEIFYGHVLLVLRRVTIVPPHPLLLAALPHRIFSVTTPSYRDTRGWIPLNGAHHLHAVHTRGELMEGRLVPKQLPEDASMSSVFPNAG